MSDWYLWGVLAIAIGIAMLGVLLVRLEFSRNGYRDRHAVPAAQDQSPWAAAVTEVFYRPKGWEDERDERDSSS